MSENPTTTKCNRGTGNCPPQYKNIGSERFGDERRVTSDMLFQFCKNDSYLYKQVKELWDRTDPEHRKRFSPPYYMDSAKSYGIEPINTNDSWFDLEDKVKLDGLTDAYHMSNCSYEEYNADFKYTNDGTYLNQNPNADYDTLVINNEDIIEDSSTLHIVSYEDEQGVVFTALPMTTSKEVTGKIPFKTYTTQTITTTTTTKEKKVTKAEAYGKLTLDAKCSGPYKDWNANSVWYIGYNRHKNYNIKDAWRKNPDNTSIPSVCRGQTFKAEHTGELRKVTLLMKGSSKSVSPCIVEIRTVKNGKPTTTILAKTEQKFNHSSKAMVNFTFKKPCKVKKGTSYAIVVRSPLSNFNHCYWLGGWASTCFSNSRKRAYYDGDTFLSENNGKTWTLHGTKEKCYGSHYYDWGFAEAPVNFGFEVYIAPSTGSKTTTSYVPTTKTNTQTVTHEHDDYYTASATLNYYEKGNYYLEFKPFAGNFYTSITCTYTEKPNEYWSHGTFTWEIYDMETGEWTTFNDYNHTQSVEQLPIINSKYQYEVVFKKALTYVKVRLKLHLEENILANISEYVSEDGTSTGKDGITACLEEIATKSGVDSNSVTSWINDIYNQFAWKGTNHDPLEMVELESVHFRLGKKPAFKGYLRTLEYHPAQEGMLPACIWAEVDADGIPKGNGTCKVDIVHEKTAIDRIQLYHANNLDLRPYIIEYETNYKLQDSRGLTNSYLTVEEIANYLYDTVDNEYVVADPEFIGFLQEQTPKVYILPYDVKDQGGTTLGTVYFFGDEETAPVELDDYLAYPVNSCSIGTEDIHLNLKDTIDGNGFVKENSNYINYDLGEDMTGKVNSVKVIYHHPNPSDEGDIEVEVIELEENNDYQINGNILRLNINQNYKKINENGIAVNSSEEPLLKQFMTLGANITLKDNNMIDVNRTEILVEMVSEDLNEFQHYITDYNSKTLNFYHPRQLLEGELKVNYNPLWCRDLEIGDFPLRMDLWTEYWHFHISGNGMAYGRCKLNDCGKVIIPETIQYKDMITTKVAPLDNLRALEVQDMEGNTLLELEEDIDYTVDYLTNKITFKNESKIEPYEGYVIMVKYTPNLTDNGLSIAYRVERPIYNGSSVINGELSLDRTSHVETGMDDYYLLSNYFTTRT